MLPVITRAADKLPTLARNDLGVPIQSDISVILDVETGKITLNDSIIVVHGAMAGQHVGGINCNDLT